MFTEGMGQQKTNSRGAKDLGDGERANRMGGQFAGLYLEGQIPSVQPDPLPKTITGSRGPVAVRLTSIPGGGLVKSRLSPLSGTVTVADEHLGRGYASSCSGKRGN